MKTKFAKSRPGTREILAAFAWAYVESSTEAELQTNRQSLIDRLHESDKRYIDETWRYRETTIIRCYTLYYPNLHAFSTQRNEPERRGDEVPDDDDEVPDCRCENKVQYKLPCRHQLLRAARRGMYIPPSLCHPRWFIDDDDPQIAAHWQPGYLDDSGIDPSFARPLANVDRGKDAISNTSANLQELFAKLPPSLAEKLRDDIEVVVHNHSHDGEGLETLLPPPHLTRKEEKLQYLKKNGKAQQRALTAEEIAARAAKKHDAYVKRKAKEAEKKAKEQAQASTSTAPARFQTSQNIEPGTAYYFPGIPATQMGVQQAYQQRGYGGIPAQPSQTPIGPPTNTPWPYPDYWGPRSKPWQPIPPPGSSSSKPPPSLKVAPATPPKSTRTRREVKAPKKWEPPSPKKPVRRPRGATIEAAAVRKAPAKKKSKAELVNDEGGR
ncbi:MAG: hypothetical protein Q9223_006516 [Gallowayella weberi]